MRTQYRACHPTLAFPLPTSAGILEVKISCTEVETTTIYFDSMILNATDRNIIEKHRLATNFRSGERCFQFEGHSSVYFAHTGRFWVYRMNEKKQVRQHYQFFSKLSRVGTLTCSHRIKLWDEMRHLSDREMARLMGFPDTYLLPKAKVNHLFGNTVCVPDAAYAISRVVDKDQKISHLDLFSGIGGFALALQSVTKNATTLACSEIFKPAWETYTKNFPGVENMGDVRNQTVFPRVDLVTAGFPCQPYSMAKTVGEEWGQIHLALLYAIKASRCNCIVLENVKQFKTTGKKIYDELMLGLTVMGFRMKECVLKSEDGGLPQERRRLYMVGRKHISPRNFERREDVDKTFLADILED